MVLDLAPYPSADATQNIGAPAAALNPGELGGSIEMASLTCLSRLRYELSRPLLISVLIIRLDIWVYPKSHT
jgi:hypothetical protein